MKRPTVRDVAREAGVSVASVSRAFSKPQEISQTTRTRILEVAEGMGYRVNRMASDFRRGTTRTIVALVSDIANPFFSEFFKGIETTARERGYITLIGDTGGQKEIEDVYIDMLATGRSDGIIFNTAHFPEGLRSAPGPVVSCNTVEGHDVDTVVVDFALGGRSVGQHLSDLGHRRFAVLAGDLGQVAIRQRHEGFSAAIAESVEDEMILQGHLGFQHGRAGAAWIVAMQQRPTAVFAHNDETAVGLMLGLAEHGIRVPDDISIVGYDDLRFASATSPGLTTVHLPRRRWGAAGCTRLMDLIEGIDETSIEVPKPELIVRGSTSRTVGGQKPG